MKLLHPYTAWTIATIAGLGFFAARPQGLSAGDRSATPVEAVKNEQSWLH